jgi:hypothetical protein
MHQLRIDLLSINYDRKKKKGGGGSKAVADSAIEGVETAQSITNSNQPFFFAFVFRLMIIFL